MFSLTVKSRPLWISESLTENTKTDADHVYQINRMLTFRPHSNARNMNVGTGIR